MLPRWPMVNFSFLDFCPFIVNSCRSLNWRSPKNTAKKKLYKSSVFRWRLVNRKDSNIKIFVFVWPNFSVAKNDHKSVSKAI
jgi:hypothetical protein